jgi:hypothetical protein
MCDMPTTANPPLSVRLDDRTQAELAELVQHFTRQALGDRIAASQVIRVAIHSLHDSTLGDS